MSKCGCHGHHGHHHFPCGCGHHHNHFHHGCYGNLPIHSSPFDLCVDRLRVRLAHLGGNLGFELHRHIGCQVEVTHSCGEEMQEVMGKICGVGGSLIHIKSPAPSNSHESSPSHSHHVISIPINHICKIKWVNKKCNPCCHSCKCVCCQDEHEGDNHY